MDSSIAARPSSQQPTPLAAVGDSALYDAQHADTGALDDEVYAELVELERVSQELEAQTLAPNTRRAYAAGWRSFSAFCQRYGVESLPAHPEAVRWYLAWMSTQTQESHQDGEGSLFRQDRRRSEQRRRESSGKTQKPGGKVGDQYRFSVATIRSHLAAIAQKHTSEGLLDPTTHAGVSSLLRGISTTRAESPVRKLPLLRDDVLRLIDEMPVTDLPAVLSAARDTAVLWLGFAGALRRSEVAGLTMRSLSLHSEDGIHVHVGASKTNQDNARPDVVVLPYGATPRTCPACAVHRWIAVVDAADRRDCDRESSDDASLNTTDVEAEWARILRTGHTVTGGGVVAS